MLSLTHLPDSSATEDVALYVARAPADAELVLDDEHDRFLWLPLEEALPLCRPPVVAEGLRNAAAWIEAWRAS